MHPRRDAVVMRGIVDVASLDDQRARRGELEVKEHLLAPADAQAALLCGRLTLGRARLFWVACQARQATAKFYPRARLSLAACLVPASRPGSGQADPT